MRYATMIALLICGAGALAQTADLGTLQKIDQNEKAQRSLDQVQALVEKIAAERKMACLKAVGEQNFCTCLTTKLPVRWSFNDYVSITTRTKEENGYAKLDAGARKGYDLVPGVRDQCVNQAFGQKQK